MYKIKNRKELEEIKNKVELSPLMVDLITKDLLIFEKDLNEDYYNKNQIDFCGPMVVVMSSEEYQNVENIIPSIDKESFEYNDIVGITSNELISKVLYLFNNGESGIIIYVVSKFQTNNLKFTGKLYATSKVENNISNEVVDVLYHLIVLCRAQLDGKLDYLQVFNIKNIINEEENLLVIEHKQEMPEYKTEIYVPGLKCENCKLFWISDSDENGNEYSTLMYAEEY